MIAASPSHRVTHTPDGKVVIHDLELFVGYIPALDGDDEDFAKWTAAEVDRVFRATSARMQAGQRPKLILGHNSSEKNAAMAMPAHGDIVRLAQAPVNGGPGLLGDVEMSLGDFDEYVASNRYPRRSAEIWQDGFMSEVALIGSETPARPLPDTRFDRDRDTQHRQLFTRALPELRMETMAMADDDKKTDGDSTIDDLREENRKLKAQLAKLKATDDDKDKDKNTDDGTDRDDMAREQFRRIAALEAERDAFQRSNKDLSERFARLESAHRAEKYGRDLDALYHQGYAVGHDGSDDRKALLQRVVSSSDPVAELEFVKKFIRQDPIDRRPVANTRVDDSDGSIDDATAAAAAQKFCLEQRSAGTEVPFKVAFAKAKRGELGSTKANTAA